MLNKNGYGTLYFGVKDNGEVLGQQIGDITLREISRAIARIGVNRTSSFVGVSTVVSMIAGVVILGETLTLWQIVGAGIIVAGIYTANIKKSVAK